MMIFKSAIKTTGILAVAATLALTGCSSTGTSSSNPPSAETAAKPEAKKKQVPARAYRNLSHVKRTGEVYLMRGLLNVFSRGMDTLAGRMRARGFDAISFNHADWRPFADDIIARSKKKQVSYPIIIMGHSLGGNEAPKMANYLAAHGVKTSLVVAFDPTEPQVVGKNIGSVVNYYLPNGRNTFARTSGFKGKLQNITVDHIPDIKHVNVEKNTRLQNQSIAHAMRITRKVSNKKIAKNRRALHVSG
ncbi:lipase family protein [Salaquimonas pukyongi]|uniref:lipase family protein n=1 Tax=Salaquimonas pukyongi TaxID=2712698 RepID=UPI00096BA410|nr:alpha/beta hydrolase [Salaquimonas pukyongi]